MSKGKRLTVGDRIMVLLLNYTRFREELQAPVDVTQDGIAKNLGIIRSAVPRAVGSLINKDLLEEHLAHIDGLTRRRKVYMLTDQGILKAKELQEEIEAIEVEVKDGESRTTERIGTLMSSGDVDLKNISEVISTGVYDKNRPKKKKEKGGKTSYIHSLTPPDMFLGRERELKDISEDIRSPKRKITVIYGIAGVGKTTLSWKITQLHAKENNIFYIDLKEWTSLQYFLKELGNFLADTGWELLKSFITSNKEVDIEGACDLLTNLPKDVPYLIIVDDLHRAPEEVNQFLSSFKERLPSLKTLNLIILSRKRASFYDIRDVRLSGIVGEMELLGFDRETSKNFLLKRGFKEDDVDTIIERTGGHPLALVLVEREGYSFDIGDFDQFLSEEIFNKLSQKAKSILGLLSLCRLQLDEDDLRTVMEPDPEALRSLMDHHLIFDTPGGYVIHDLIRDHTINNQTQEELIRSHSILANLFHGKLCILGFHQEIDGDVPPYPFGLEDETELGPVPLYVSEEIHHHIGADRAENALETMIKATTQIPTKDLIKEVGDKILASLPARMEVEKELLRDLLVVLKDIMEDRNEKALEGLKGIGSKKKVKGDMAKAVVDCTRLWAPYLEEKVEGPEKALKSFEKIGDDVPEKLKYYFLVTRAALLYKLGDHTGASKAYRSFLDTILENEDLPMQLRDSVKDSLERAQRGSIEVATDNFQRIMELTEANRDVLKEEMPYVDVDHHLLSAIYSLYHGMK